MFLVPFLLGCAFLLITFITTLGSSKTVFWCFLGFLGSLGGLFFVCGFWFCSLGFCSFCGPFSQVIVVQSLLFLGVVFWVDWMFWVWWILRLWGDSAFWISVFLGVWVLWWRDFSMSGRWCFIWRDQSYACSCFLWIAFDSLDLWPGSTLLEYLSWHLDFVYFLLPSPFFNGLWAILWAFLWESKSGGLFPMHFVRQN